jgi:MFS family permease
MLIRLKNNLEDVFSTYLSFIIIAFEMNKNTFFASLGSILEYFDFSVYGLLAIYIGEAYFPDTDSIASSLSLSIFALGHIARPLGGTISGIIGDMYGRRRVFLFLTGLMAITTLCIGILPSYKNWGVLAPIILVILRVLQGISFGGEMAGAVIIVGESSCDKERSSNTGFMLSGTTIGAVFATGILFFMTKYLSREQIIDGAWRVPFIIGGMLGIILWILRRKLTETAEYIRLQSYAPQAKTFQEMILLIKSNAKYIILAMMLTLFTSSLLIVNIFYPVFINEYFSINVSNIYKATTVSLILSCFYAPIVGIILRYVSKYNLLIMTYLVYICSYFFLFMNLKEAGELYLTLFIIINNVFISVCYTCHISINYELFPTEIRYTGVAFSGNIVSAIVSLLPLLLKNLKLTYNNPIAIPIVLIALCCISLISAILAKRYSKVQSQIVYKKT